MWIYIIYCLVSGIALYITCATVYLLYLAGAYFFKKDPTMNEPDMRLKFAILVPAHNEELLIARLCESLLHIAYPKELYDIHIIADNCIDATVDICSTYPVHVVVRTDKVNTGKGHAISWALNQIAMEKIDAVLIVDADNVVDERILDELNVMMVNGERAIQCHNAVGNRDDSWFTQLLHVSRTISNHLYHHAKYKLRLSSYLMGNGICFSTDLLTNIGWSAFSIGEDWEYYAKLIDNGTKIGFALNAKVYHQESKSLNQATTQRLRWSSGRFSIVKSYGLRLFWKGIRTRNWRVVDACFPLIFPNYSLQINLTVIGLVISLFLSVGTIKTVFFLVFLFLLFGQFLLFIAGTIIAGSTWKVWCAVLYVPLFLVWKAIIDILCVTKLYGNKKWVRTKRHIP